MSTTRFVTQIGDIYFVKKLLAVLYFSCRQSNVIHKFLENQLDYFSRSYLEKYEGHCLVCFGKKQKKTGKRIETEFISLRNNGELKSQKNKETKIYSTQLHQNFFCAFTLCITNCKCIEQSFFCFFLVIKRKEKSRQQSKSCCSILYLE